MVAIWMFLMRRVGGGPTQALSFGRSKHKIYDRKELKTTFADVAGVDEAKAELVEIDDFLQNPKKYQRLGGRIPKGVLLDRKSTRLNSSHTVISYAVFCLKKKTDQRPTN